MRKNFEQTVKTTCDMCSSGCGVLINIKNGRIEGVRGDPESPINKGAICAKGLASLEFFYSPYRLKSPLKRIGARGEGKWQKISWDEALNTIASKLNGVKEKYGPESVAFIAGSNKGFRDTFLARFSNAFGSPNHTWAGYTCYMPRYYASTLTYGYNAVPDYEYPPASMIVWGSNVRESRYAEYAKTLATFDRGTRLMVIDPVESEFAKRADLWLRVRPATDLALALGMINVIINEGWYDKEFVEKWTTGFDALKSHIQQYSPEVVEKITWVTAADIRKASRFYVEHRPSAIQWGNGLDTSINSLQASRAICILRAITGNLEIPGGELNCPLTGLGNKSEITLQQKLSAETWNKRLDAENKTLSYISDILPQSAVKAMLYGKPYPVKAAYMQGCNPLLSWADAKETYQALKKLDFFAVAELFMTSSAALADIVLPAATYLEFTSIILPPYCQAYQIQQKITEDECCWSDYKILSELAKRTGIGEYFTETEEDIMSNFIKPSGLTLDELATIGAVAASKKYRSYQNGGFKTPSGKVELYSSQLEKWGYDPLPVYREMPGTVDDKDLAKEYPYTLSSSKLLQFRHSGGKQISTLRGSHPDPIITIHKKTAAKLSIADGDWVFIETKLGKIKQKAALSEEIDPRAVIVDFGWWYPERDESSLFGWDESNVNVLTSNKPPFNAEMGSVNFRGIACKVYRAN